MNIIKSKSFKTIFCSYLLINTYYWNSKKGNLNINYKGTKLREIIDLNPSLNETKIYKPSFFFNNGHLQTILLLVKNRYEKMKERANKPKKNYSKVRKIFHAKDGEILYVDFWEKTTNLDPSIKNYENFSFLKENKRFDNSNILVVVPGACGSTQEFYLKDIIERFVKLNFKVIAINHRGIPDNKLITGNHLYHTGYTKDLKEIMEQIMIEKKLINNSKLFLIGFSMGGNIVTKFLGENEDCENKYSVKGGASICGPLDLRKLNYFLEGEESKLNSKNDSENNKENNTNTNTNTNGDMFGRYKTGDYFNIESSLRKIYSKVFCSNLKGVFNKNKEELMKNKSKEEKDKIINTLNKCKFSSEYYKNYIFDCFGYKNEEEYNRINSGCNYISKIRVPFLCIFAKDDPIVPHDSIDHTDYLNNENIILAKTNSGGHVGFFKGLFLKNRWIHEPLVSFINDVSIKI